MNFVLFILTLFIYFNAFPFVQDFWDNHKKRGDK